MIGTLAYQVVCEHVAAGLCPACGGRVIAFQPGGVCHRYYRCPDTNCVVDYLNPTQGFVVLRNGDVVSPFLMFTEVFV